MINSIILSPMFSKWLSFFYHRILRLRLRSILSAAWTFHRRRQLEPKCLHAPINGFGSTHRTFSLGNIKTWNCLSVPGLGQASHQSVKFPCFPYLHPYPFHVSSNGWMSNAILGFILFSRFHSSQLDQHVLFLMVIYVSLFCDLPKKHGWLLCALHHFSLPFCSVDIFISSRYQINWCMCWKCLLPCGLSFSLWLWFHLSCRSLWFFLMEANASIICLWFAFSESPSCPSFPRALAWFYFLQ